MLEKIGLVRGIAGAVLFLAAASGIYIGVEEVSDTPDNFPDGFGYAIDVSGELITPAKAESLKAEGVSLGIQALTWWPRCGAPTTVPWTRVESLRNMRDAGLQIAGYFLVDYHTSGHEAFRKAREGIPEDLWNDLKFVALDVEVPGECRPWANVPYQTVLEGVDAMRAAGKPPVIYTNYGNWNDLNYPCRPEGVLLWNAYWKFNPDDPSLAFPRLPYGCWTEDEVVLEQFTGGSQVGLVYADRNIVRLSTPVPTATATPAPTATPEPPVITPPACKCDPCDVTADWGGIRACWNGAAWYADDGRVLVPLADRWLWFGAQGELIHVQAVH